MSPPTPPTPCSGGPVSVNAPLLSLLVHSCGGELCSHPGYGPTFERHLAQSLTRRFGTSAVLDCHVTDGARLVQWTGPVDVLKVTITSLGAAQATQTLGSEQPL